MKKMIIGLVIMALFIIVPLLTLLVTRSIVCKPDENVYSVSLPLAKAVVTHIETYGIPKKLEDVENLPYILNPCSDKPTTFTCYDYFFEDKGKYYTAELLVLSGGVINLLIENDYTANYYDLFRKNKLEEDYLSPRIYRRPIGVCHELRQ